MRGSSGNWYAVIQGKRCEFHVVIVRSLVERCIDAFKAMGDPGQRGRTIYDILIKQKVIERGKTMVTQVFGDRSRESRCRLKGYQIFA
jgi:hypothetical protein